MNSFRYSGKELTCDGVSVARIAAEVGTPAYIYSLAGIEANYDRIDRAIGAYPHVVCYALKANSNPEILRRLAARGAGADVVSGGELRLALQAGFPAKKIVYAGVGKTDAEIRLAIQAGILALNVESRQELEVTAQIAQEMGQTAPVALRINPDIDIEGHPYLTTGKSANKFGIEMGEAKACYLWAAKQPSIKIVGVHCHVGSMIRKPDPFYKSAETLAQFVAELKSAGIEMEHIDLGGGFGVDYETVLADQGSCWLIEPEAVMEKVVPILQETGCELMFEPGRSIVGPHGVLMTRVLYTKETKGKQFAIVDAAMNDLIRPSLYGARHEVLPVMQGEGAAEPIDVVGPICESGDFLAKDYPLTPVKRGDLLAVMTAGAYGYTLASNYNTRGRGVEVLVEDGGWYVIRERENPV
ncbi:diaminopimelate decarboxylase [candidate division KSB1 bacterium]|nr:diaminopimelate decarboxylase [candidate division KSB1 bacterium]